VLPRDIVCLRNVSINILHKGDDDDNTETESLKKHLEAILGISHVIQIVLQSET